MNRKIVVIDDDPVTREILDKMLSKDNFEVFLAKDGKSGHELVLKEKPDLVLLDLLLPKIHGLDVCCKIKDDPNLKKIKVILMTSAYKSPAFRQEISLTGADDFIEKPLDTIELMKKVYRLCIEIAEEDEKSSSS
jgi:DNA-binding response OmpR family regulator